MVSEGFFTEIIECIKTIVCLVVVVFFQRET